MKYNDENKTVSDLKIAYIGGGSRGWAWSLMSDLAKAKDISGSVYLYDIDYEAAKHNETIGNSVKDCDGCLSVWKYKASKTIKEALEGADFVIISILPGTFDEMHSDVHTPEKYGIYQSVGDTTGPGGIVRALRTIPMIQEIARAIEKYSPDAWVINYTNPLAICVKTLYETFPKIKAFGCCHEVFGTQKVLGKALDAVCGIKDVKREDININVLGLNHFTWITSAKYRNMDLFDVYREYIQSHRGEDDSSTNKGHWMNSGFVSGEKVKFNLFERFGAIAAAGDRHLVEFCPGKWYLGSPEQVEEWGFKLTTVDWRKEDLEKRLDKSQKILSGEIPFEISDTGEEGVNQIRALCGLSRLVTNVNIPNRGQIPNMPIGAVVETNACFRSNTLEPIFAGEAPDSIHSMLTRVADEQLTVVNGAINRDLKEVFNAFANNSLVDISVGEAKELFVEMVNNTKEYLTDYDLTQLDSLL